MRGPFDILLTSRRGDQELVLKLTSSITLILQSDWGSATHISAYPFSFASSSSIPAL